jgi:hypothetical protein
MTRKTVLLNICIYLCLFSYDQAIHAENLPVEKFHSITLEMSLKPFKKKDKSYIQQVCKDIFTQWAPLLKHADTVSVMLWTADGSEILDYSGNPNQRLEWGMYIGNPNTGHAVNSGPASLSIHERAYTYLDNPPEFTYGDLKLIVEILKEVGRRVTGKPVRVGNTFDPGPEFAKSPFKYQKHPEICMGNTMGTKTFVCCYATLNEDKGAYAGYPDGIPQGTPLGTFLGRQSQHFLTDLGFDYLWLSNGFGFGLETWSATGAIFDGKNFQREKIHDTKRLIMEFWKQFRAECPGFRIETRGTNMSTGIDLASDGVDLRDIYNGSFNLLPPPNSPWAALDGDYGLELAGYMSRMAELPDERYLFRYYTHDPWWSNSPWLDRYGREAHDIYLPMAVSRINGKGETRKPTHLNFLSIDDSYGNMPDQVPEEVIPHIIQGRRVSPDQAGVLVWVYPFDEYHRWAYQQPERMEEIYYADWFIRQAVNDGFPLNTVVSTSNFASLMLQGYTGFNESILVTVAPEAASETERQLIGFVRKGGRLMVYGPVNHASPEFLEFINVKTVEPVSGEFSLNTLRNFDIVKAKMPEKLRHDAIMSGGGIETVAGKANESGTEVLVCANGKDKRDIVILCRKKEWNGGAVCYIRGTNSAYYKGGKLLTPDDPEKWIIGGSLMRYGFSRLGYHIHYEKPSLSVKSPVNVISRFDNGFYFAGYVPNQTVEHRFRFPQGAPIFTGMETELKDGYATYRFPKAWNEECRIFVEQESGIISCFEIPRRYKTNRRVELSGLSNATVRFYHSRDESSKLKAVHNVSYPFNGGDIDPEVKLDYMGHYSEFRNVSGYMVFAW